MTRRGVTKKPAVMCSREFARVFGSLSKQALIDTLWCACQLGTDESAEQITTQAARNAGIALERRGDRVPKEIVDAGADMLDSDPEGDRK